MIMNLMYLMQILGCFIYILFFVGRDNTMFVTFLLLSHSIALHCAVTIRLRSKVISLVSL